MYINENINKLKRKFPNIKWDMMSQLQNTKENQVDIETSQKGIDTLKVSVNGTVAYLHSKYDPLSEAERIADSLELKPEDRHLLFYGIGLGYVLDVMKKRNPVITYSIYEPNPLIFLRFISSRKLSDEFVEALSGICIKGLNFNGELDLLYFFQRLDFFLKPITLPSYERIYAEDYNNFCHRLKDSIVDKRFRIGTKFLLEKQWVHNILKNFPYTVRSENILNLAEKVFYGKPAILVASGPSLDEEIENLKKIKSLGLAYIFSAGSAVYKLSKHGILPDAVCAIDGAQLNYEIYKNLFKNPENKTPLIFADMMYDEVVSSYNARLFNIIMDNDPLASYYLKYNSGRAVKKLKIAPSIALIVMQILYKLQCDPIILVGQNFALKNDYYYAAGIDFHKDRKAKEKITERDRKNSFPVEDVHGGMVYTMKNLDVMRRNMEILIKYYPIKNVINTTQGGAKISDTKYMPLAELIKERLDKSVVDPRWYKIESESYDQEYIIDQHKLMLEEKSEIHNAIKKIGKELNKIEKAVQNRNENKLGKLLFDFSKISKELTRNKFYETFIYPMNTLKMELLTSSLGKTAREEDLIKKGRKALKDYKEFIDEVKKLIIEMEPEFEEFNEKMQSLMN